MHDPRLSNPDYLSLTDKQLAEIDELCDLFDRELATGDGLCIESILRDAPEGAHDGLLVELLTMEFEFRVKRGEVLHPDEYLKRFPNMDLLILDLICKFPKPPSVASTDTIKPSTDTIPLPTDESRSEGDSRDQLP